MKLNIRRTKNSLILNSTSNSNMLVDGQVVSNDFLNDSLVDRYNKIDNILDEDENTDSLNTSKKFLMNKILIL